MNFQTANPAIPIPPEVEIRLQALIASQVERHMIGNVQMMVAEEFRKRDETTSKSVQQAIQQKVDNLTETNVTNYVNGFVQELTKKISAQLNTFDHKIKDLYTISFPAYYVQEMQNVLRRMANFEGIIAAFRVQLKDFVDRWVEVVSDEEIRRLYSQSGLQLKNIQDRFQFTTLSTAHKLVHGETKDIIMRHQLKQFLLTMIRENELKNV